MRVRLREGWRLFGPTLVVLVVLLVALALLARWCA